MNDSRFDLRSNRVLTAADRESLAPSVAELTRLCPDIMSRKIPEAVFQNAFIFEQVIRAAKPGDEIVIIGGYEDPIGPALQQLGHQVAITDPLVDGRDALAVWLDARQSGQRYDIIACCSVLEHVGDDELFIQVLYGLLKPGGHAFLTTDYRDDWREGMPAPDILLYTSERLRGLAVGLPQESLIDVPTWGPQQPYFQYNNVPYCFCSLAFRRLETGNERDGISEISPERLLQAVHQRNLRLGRDIVERNREIAGLHQAIASLQGEIAAQRAELARFAVVKEAGPRALRLAAAAHAAARRIRGLRRAVAAHLS